MNGIRAQVLTAVAYQPTMLFVPTQLGAIMAALHVILMMMGLLLFKLTPFIWLFSLGGFWILTAIYTAKDPHLATVMVAVGQSKHRSRNIIRMSEGVKYVP